MSDILQGMNFEKNALDMKDYEGLSRIVIIKKKKGDVLVFSVKYDSMRKGNVS